MVSPVWEKLYPYYVKAEETFERLYWEIDDTRSIAQFVFLCSGGYDSMVATEVSDNIIRCMYSRSYWRPQLLNNKIVYINTKTGIKENREFVWWLVATQFGEERFHEYVTPESYRELCLRHGFPGPSSHKWMYIRLKERCIKQVVRDHTYQIDKRALRDVLNDMRQLYPLYQQFLLEQIRHDMARALQSRGSRIVFITGARQPESDRRARHVTPIQYRGREIWLSPLATWGKEQVLDARDYFRLPHSPVADVLHRSKDCMCGAFAEEGEKAEIEFWFPEEGAWLNELEREVMAAGFPWGWEQSPPKWWNERKKGQMSLWSDDELAPPRNEIPQNFFPLCSTCTTLHQDSEQACQLRLQEEEI